MDAWGDLVFFLSNILALILVVDKIFWVYLSIWCWIWSLAFELMCFEALLFYGLCMRTFALLQSKFVSFECLSINNDSLKLVFGVSCRFSLHDFGLKERLFVMEEWFFEYTHIVTMNPLLDFLTQFHCFNACHISLLNDI